MPPFVTIGRGCRAPSLDHLRRARRFLKATALAVTTAFLGLTLQPLAIAANLPARNAPDTRPASNDAKLARTLEAIEDRLDKLDQKLGKKEDATKEKAELKDLRQELEIHDRQALADFDKIGKHLKDKNLPQVILSRHTEAVKQYQQEMTTLKVNLDDLDKAKDDTERQARAKKAKEHVKSKQAKTKRPPLDPSNLPTRALQPNKNNKPKLRKAEFHAAGLYDHPTVKLAALGDFTFDKLPGASDPAYLSGTPEVVLSDAIKAKAAELEYNPVKIFNWVHDRTEWLPTWGAIQNADVALLSQKGNAFDLSSLLIALLRASGIPARYVHGTIEIPATRFMNWAGGFTDPNGAWDLASAAGTPITAVTSGGKVTKFRLEHVWVEAAIDFHPSRGTVNKSADTWVALDPSFKQYQTERGYDMHSLLNLNGNEHFMAYLTDPTEETPYQYYSKKVLDYLNTNMSDWTLEGLYGHEHIVPFKSVTNGNLRQFAASLPYVVLVRGYVADAISDILRHQLTVELANDLFSGGSVSYTTSLSALGHDRLTLSYVPDSAADDAVVSDYGSLYSAPAYLMRVKPQIRKAGQVVEVGSGIGLGEEQIVTIYLYSPGLSINPVVNQLKAGNYSALVFQGLSASGGRPSTGMKDLWIGAELNEQGQSTLDATFGQLLHNVGILWFHDITYERNFYATTFHVAYTQALSQAIVTADLTVSYWFGIPRSVQRIFYTIDADTDRIAAGATDGRSSRVKDFFLLSGLSGSTWEHLELEGVFSGPGASAVKIIKTATEQGIPIYTIDQTNVGQVLPQLALAPEDVTDVVNAVNAGRRVVVPQRDVQVGQWRGAGIIALDPVKGDGLYLLTGGLAGGSACGTGEDKFQVCTPQEWEAKVSSRPAVAHIARQMLIFWATKMLDTPYAYGCRGPDIPLSDQYWCTRLNAPDEQDGIDCSGLVAYAYRRVGNDVLTGKDAAGQYAVAPFRPSSTEKKAGDLIFWKDTNTRKPGISHVGIVYVTPGAWIAAQKSRGVNIYYDSAWWQAHFVGYGALLEY